MANRLIPDAELSYWRPGISSTVRPRLVRVLLERDGNACGVCGAPLDDDQVIDHIVPHGHGWSGEQWNLRVVHVRCNHFNNTQPLSERILVASANRLAVAGWSYEAVAHHLGWRTRQGCSSAIRAYEDRMGLPHAAIDQRGAA